MTKEQNIFLAKRNLIDTLWKDARLEGIDITFPETSVIYDGGNVSHLRVDEIVTINNLKHAWNFLLTTIDQDINLNYISSLNSLIGSNLVDNAGKMRTYDVKIGGTNWKPSIPSKENLETVLNKYNTQEKSQNNIMELMCKMMKMQYFSDGNKRTSMLVANHELIKNSQGIIAVPEDKKVEFGNLLINYYENEENLSKLTNFLCENCIDTIEENNINNLIENNKIALSFLYDNVKEKDYFEKCYKEQDGYSSELIKQDIEEGKLTEFNKKGNSYILYKDDNKKIAINTKTNTIISGRALSNLLDNSPVR